MTPIDQPGRAGTFLWIGDGGRPTYGVVEHFLRWRYPELSTAAERHHRLGQWRLYTLDCRPTQWPLAKVWPRHGPLQGDFLVWDAAPYGPYDVVFVDNLLCSGHATQSADRTTDTWESPTLQGQTRQSKLAIWAARLATLAAAYVLTSGTADPDDPEDGDVIPDMTAFDYTLVACSAMIQGCILAGMSGTAATFAGQRAGRRTFCREQSRCLWLKACRALAAISRQVRRVTPSRPGH